ncbi:MAG: hypothetical protein K5685_09715 [Bacteroidales bacterium]|nr:hypothetical protein [Bacteroidales bacterium]
MVEYGKFHFEYYNKEITPENGGRNISVKKYATVGVILDHPALIGLENVEQGGTFDLYKNEGNTAFCTNFFENLYFASEKEMIQNFTLFGYKIVRI